MIITFISCFLNHHQLSLCQELKARCDKFYFVATAPLPRERGELGYEDLNTKYDFVVRTYDSTYKRGTLERLLSESDVVIFGTSPNKYIEYRVAQGKLAFIYSERFFKKGVWRNLIPTTRKKIKNRVVRFKDNELYVLCASAFLSYDLKLCGYDEKKCLKWGYFPVMSEKKEYPERKNSKLRILWAGRMIPFKRGEHALKAAHSLHKAGVDFSFDFIGRGECEAKYRRLAKRFKIDDKVNFLGSMSPDEVKENMSKADIFLMSSDFREGWGAVVNEAMSEGCAVLASSAAGATAYLIDDGENGLIYKYGNQRDFNEKLRALALDKALRKKLGRKAFDSIRNDYSASVAAERLVEFARACDKEKAKYESGPVSRAEIIENNWYKI